jgi:hypothetical protein
MTIWKSFGASVQGPGHIASGTPNQDSWKAFHHDWGDGIIVSDGVGSKPFSEFGSHTACKAVLSATLACRRDGFDRMRFADSIKDTWLSLVSPRDPRDCAATCLFALRPGDGAIHLWALGDGLASVLKTDGSIVSLLEDKSEGFSNITAALSPNVSPDDWRNLSLPEEECNAVLLCTDGVADDLVDLNGFVKHFIESHRALSLVAANRQVQEMLRQWPTPQHSDDKTIACLCREEVGDE